jgi:predicted N-formylglutamate amidohydrolase
VTVVDLPSRNLLAADEPPPFHLEAHGRRWPALLVCDHASRRIPRALANLGLPESALQRHIAWDIGAAQLARALASTLEIPALLAGYSRLVVDCNRHLEDPSSIVTESDGQIVPGNVSLTAAQREARARSCFWPYHRAVDQALGELARGDDVPALIAIHSFTPQMLGITRPWHCGILWDRDPRMATPLLDALRAEEGIVVGDNEPYSGRHPADYTVDVHAENRGWPHVCIEIRQDLITESAGVAAWTARLARALGPILSEPALYREQRFSDATPGLNGVRG